MTTHIGNSPHRKGGYERVTGAQEYLADITFDDVLHAGLVTIPCGRARIISIDTGAAEAVPGVALVMTAEDLPQPVPRYGPQYQDRPVLAVGETKFHGEPVAAVAADTKDAAEEAARLVRVEYEELPGVYSVEGALAAEAPLVREPELRPEDDEFRESNVLAVREYGWGDVDEAEDEADLVIDESYSFPMVTHFAIEPHGFAAAPDDDGIAIWSTIQHPYLLQKLMARLLDLPLAKVRVYAPDPGGGFGGKQNIKLEPLVAFMALETGRPVRLVLSLDESFQAARRVSAEIRVRSGFGANGDLVFEDIESDCLLGAYADIAERVVAKSQYTAAGPYRVPNVRIRARSILSNTTPACAFRGFGTPQVNWAVESNIDAGARALGIDRAQIRLRNLAARGEEVVPGDTPADGLWSESVEKAMELIGWDTPLPEGHGRGIAVGIKSSATTGLSYSTVRLLADGSVIVSAGTSDMGQGARTIFAQIAATEMGTPLDEVEVIMGDTSVVPYDQQTSASRSTVFMGNAIMRACRDIQAQVLKMAAAAESVPESQIVIERGMVNLPDRDVPIIDVVRTALGRLGGEVIGNGSYRKDVEPGHPLGGSPAFYEFNCTAVEVSVDEDTGHITIHDHVIVGDTGRSLNPQQVAGQDEGAAIMGLGHTLMEHMILDESGRVRNLGAIDYRIPTSMDLPLEMVSAAIENEDGPGPYGSKGVSEGGLLSVQSAVGSAVAEATGVVIRDLPLTPERVWRSLRDARTNQDTDDQ
jgi:CO/xanthine dehydrogenase Mo-binding subunit